MHRIVYLERSTVIAEVRHPDFPHNWVEYPMSSPGEMMDRLTGCTIAIVNKLPLTRAMLASLPDLQMIAVPATGTNHIDLDACRERGVVVSNVRDYAGSAIAEHVFMMMFALSRNLIAYRHSLFAGEWHRSDQFCLFAHPISDLDGATLGIVGQGSLGRSVAKLAKAFGMRVLFAERKGASTVRPGYTAFDAVLREADVLTLHCPLSEETRGLIGEDELRAMRPSALLINTARGGLVDEAALIRALDEKWIAGAGFDVVTTEPPPAGHPMLAPGLLGRPNFLLTPHVAFASRGSMQRLSDQLIDNIEAFVAGQPRNQVA